MNIAFVSPRLHEPGTVGGAETLLYCLAQYAVKLGHSVEFLCTCAKNHYTWENELPEESFERDGIRVQRFKVDDRSPERFLELQLALSRGANLSRGEQVDWLTNSVNSSGIINYLLVNAQRFDRVITGPYLFGLVYSVAKALPDKTLLVPCFHDEPFAKVPLLQESFRHVRGFLFNTDPERQLAHNLMPGLSPRVESVVAMGIEPFTVSKTAFREHHPELGDSPYVIYCGRREPLKGTPLLVDYVDAFRRRTGIDLKLVLTGSGNVDVPPTLRGAYHDYGFVSEQEKREAMAGAVAFVHPSVNESLSIVILEAWLGQTPALVHSCGKVLRWQCESSCGGLWFADYIEFEEELKLYLEKPQIARKLGEQGRIYTLMRYSPDAVAARFGEALLQ